MEKQEQRGGRAESREPRKQMIEKAGPTERGKKGAGFHSIAAGTGSTGLWELEITAVGGRSWIQGHKESVDRTVREQNWAWN